MNRAETLTLDSGHFATLRGATQFRVTHGSVWLTVDGDLDDIFIECGQGVALPPSARVLVQALHVPVRALILRPAGWRERAGAAWHALTHRHAGVHG